MQQSAGSRSTPIGPILAIVGGALLAIGSFLSWATVSGTGTEVSATGMDGSDGVITLVAGLAALACGVIAMKAGRRALAVIAIVAGLIGAGVGLYDALTAKDSVLDSASEEVATQVGATTEEVRAFLDDAIDAGQLSISIGIGLYIVIGGGVIALVGGVLQMGGKGASASVGAPATPAGFATSSAAAPPPAAPMQSDMTPPAAPAPPPPPDAPPSP